jgi:peptidoglycan/xylan/chitin deacetylase (PgdA/CDA1 family)
MVAPRPVSGLGSDADSPCGFPPIRSASYPDAAGARAADDRCAMRARFMLAASVLAASVLSAAGCTAPGRTDAPTSAARAATALTTARSSAVWEMAASLVDTEWDRLPATSKVVALTFDAGSGDQGVASILSTLAEKKVTATFFLTGKWVEAFPADAAAIGDRYPIGNHTFGHLDLATLSDSEVVAEVKGGADAIRTATQVDARPLFRFPYGSRDQRTIGIVNGLGYGSIRWTVDTLGWKGASEGQSVETVQSRVLSLLQPGEIVLMHVGAANDGTTLDADALAGVIDAIRAKGYGFTDLYRFAARYAQVADDGTDRFSASSAWRMSTSRPQFHGSCYHVASPAAFNDPARLRLRAPQTARYRVYAWWPISASYNPAVTVRVTALGGLALLRRRPRHERRPLGPAREDLAQRWRSLVGQGAAQVVQARLDRSRRLASH